MPSAFISLIRRHAAAPLILAALSLPTGCATAPEPITPAPDAVVPADVPTLDQVPVVRSGRYTLVEIVPERGQRDPMEQIVDVAIPATMTPTVGEALRYVLLRSGYRLCEGDEATRELDALPLPAVHLHLGPLTLRQALEILIGSARELTVDEASRQVCVRHRSSMGTAPGEIVSRSQLPPRSM